MPHFVTVPTAYSDLAIQFSLNPRDGSEKHAQFEPWARPLITLPASSFPDRADVYVCDKCGRDITKHFRPSRSHACGPMGCETYRCLCGQRYRTGATEWGHLGDWERSRRIRETAGLGGPQSAMFSVPGFLAYLVLHFVFGLREGALATGLVITALPFSLMQITFWPGVVASMWRTRVGTGVASDKVNGAYLS